MIILIIFTFTQVIKIFIKIPSKCHPSYMLKASLDVPVMLEPISDGMY